MPINFPVPTIGGTARGFVFFPWLACLRTGAADPTAAGAAIGSIQWGRWEKGHRDAQSHYFEVRTTFTAWQQTMSCVVYPRSKNSVCRQSPRRLVRGTAALSRLAEGCPDETWFCRGIHSLHYYHLYRGYLRAWSFPCDGKEVPHRHLLHYKVERGLYSRVVRYRLILGKVVGYTVRYTYNRA